MCSLVWGEKKSACNLNQNKSDKHEISGKILEVHFLIIGKFLNYYYYYLK